MDVRNYTFSEAAIKKLAMKKVFGIQPLIFGVLVAAFLIANKIGDNAFTNDKNLLFILIGIFLVVYIGGIFSAKKSVKQILRQVSFKITDTSVEYCIPNGKNTKLAFREIKNQKLYKYGLKLYSVNEQIFISNKINNFNEIVKTLKDNTQTRLIQHTTKFKINQIVLNNITGLSFLAMITSLFLVETRELKLVLGVPLFFILVYSVISLSKNKDIPSEFNWVHDKFPIY